MGYSFLDLAKDMFKTVRKPLSINEIWKEAVKSGNADKVGTSGKTPWQTLGARIYMDIKQNPDTEFAQISKRPAKFYLKSLCNDELNIISGEQDQKAAGEENQKASFKERDLHILLSTFVYSNPHFNCYTKTIFHENSKKNKKGYNKWLHPDLVGIYFPFDEYQGSTLKLQEILKENPYKLFSFEMKIELSFANLRECYFQAVSNSSWAHEGYLVALKIEDEPLLLDEIRRLNNAFGIGVIRLNAENIEQSEILFSAKGSKAMDWDTIDRLVEENSDFKNFIEDLMEDIKIGKVKSGYDKIPDSEEYDNYVKDKGII